MGMAALTLIANPGSASRKYALYNGDECLARLHFENENGAVVCTLSRSSGHEQVQTSVEDVTLSARQIIDILRQRELFAEGDSIGSIGIRVVAPGSDFLQHRAFDDRLVERLQQAAMRAPLHVAATLREVELLREQFADVPIVAATDSAFHATKPDYAWNYGIDLRDADRFDIKRFGYHGLSVGSAIDALHEHGKLPNRVIVCHLGGGASVTAVYKGASLDTTMGYSPLEGMVMATRTGNIDPTAVRDLQESLGLDNAGMEDYLHHRCGLMGLSGGASDDIRELLRLEGEGHDGARLALQTYVYNLQKAIGQMAATIGGADVLVFTGTVGERSAHIRRRVFERLGYLDFFIDNTTNDESTGVDKLTCISHIGRSRPVFIIPANEEAQILKAVHQVVQ